MTYVTNFENYNILRESLDRCQKNPASKAKFATKKTFFARRFYTLYEQKLSNLIPILSITFPPGFQKSKKFGHWTLGSWGKQAFKRIEQAKKSF